VKTSFTLILVASALVLAGCASAGSGGTGGSTANPAAGGSGGGKPSCARFSASTLSALIKGPVSQPYIAGSDSAGGVECVYGIGKNAKLTGSKIEATGDDSMLITVIGYDGKSQYKHFTAKDTNFGGVTATSGVGDASSYNYSSVSKMPPNFYSYKGDRYCGVALSLASSTEVGIPESGGDAAYEISQSDAADIATKEGALCSEAW
jgi:hypothetical protein